MPSLLNKFQHLWKIWRSTTRASLVREIAFRGNFLVGLARQVAWLGAFILIIDIIFQNTGSLAGWSQVEVLLIVGLSRLFEGTSDLLFTRNIIEIFPASVNDGKFDFILTKPVPAQLLIAFQRLHIANSGNLLAGVLLTTYALTRLDSTPSISMVAAFILLALTGLTIRYAILIGIASLTFVLERFNSMWAFDVVLTEPLTYPFDVFPRGPRIALTYFLPLAFIVFVPAQALTGRLALWQLPVAIGIAALFLLLANLAWRAGLRRYTSASS